MGTYESRRDLQTPAANEALYPSIIVVQKVVEIDLHDYPDRSGFSSRDSYDFGELERWLSCTEWPPNANVRLRVHNSSPVSGCLRWVRPDMNIQVVGRWPRICDQWEVAIVDAAATFNEMAL